MKAHNGLYPLSAAGSLLAGIFLLLGAYGHFEAVLPSLSAAHDDANAFALLLPGSILAAAGVLSVALCKSLWDGRRRGLNAALTINTLTLAYLLYLMWQGVPNHPVAVFTGIVACNLVVLLTTRLGMVWQIGGAAAGSGGRSR
jgi:hypothetical protein